jgi:hypothetical protein
LIASDGGYPPQQRFRSNGLPGVGAALLMLRVNEMGLDQVGALRRRMLVGELLSGAQHGAIANLGSSVAAIAGRAQTTYVRNSHPEQLIPNDLLRRLQSTRTHLDRFSPVEAEALSYHAYLLLDAVLTIFRASQPPRYQVKGPGTWIIDFTKSTRALWEECLQAHPS